MLAPMDKARFSVAVYKRTGIPLGQDDPAFALVELNRLALAEMIEEAADRFAERVNALPERIQSSAKLLAAEVGSQGVQRVVEMLRESRRTLACDTERTQERFVELGRKVDEALAQQAALTHAPQRPPCASCMCVRWFLAGVAIGVVACAAAVVADQCVATASPFNHSTRR